MRPDERQLEEVVRRIVEAARPVRVLLFGSAARGEMAASSDLDVLVVVKDGTPRRPLARSLYPLLVGVGVGVDIVVATESELERHAETPGLIYREALRHGRVLYAA
jgi:predicted nucleotidyltransferase